MVGFVVAISLNQRIGWNEASLGPWSPHSNTGFRRSLVGGFAGAQAAGPIIVDYYSGGYGGHPPAVYRPVSPDGADTAWRQQGRQKAQEAWWPTPCPGPLGGGQGICHEPDSPGPVDAGSVGRCCSPVALFTIGAVLARFKSYAVS
jgi:hypothetical protein